jgi:sec-independent protein translocase protein TatB
MFDVGFWELSLLFVVALLVVGPERLPRLARTAGLWFGKANRIIQSVKSEINREIAAEELKAQLQKQAGIEELHEIVEETNQAVAGIAPGETLNTQDSDDGEDDEHHDMEADGDNKDAASSSQARNDANQ